MKYFLAIFILFSSQSFAGLIPTSSTTDVKVGDEFRINIAFEHEAGASYSELYGFDFVFDFNDSVAALDPSKDTDFVADGIQLAEPFNSNGDWGLDIFGDYAFAANYGFPSIDPFDISKPVWDILSFDFIAIKEGDFNLNISDMLIVDEFFNSIAVENSSISVNVTSAQTVDEPSTFILVLLSLIAVCFKREKGPTKINNLDY
ncbi:hypothetical protein [Colwellia sp. UCD-KL20]|uniref:hypothetical protein n=1 Tax=Colwellia sp. UCD-KL20 TaxID=1917165 RepID=UPI000970D38F|nr:hypothetical protein [Colwellia sp. UCD-KL20]